MFSFKESSANDSYQDGGSEDRGESHLSSSREDRIFNSSKCKLVITPACTLQEVGETEDRKVFPTAFPMVCSHTAKLSADL